MSLVTPLFEPTGKTELVFIIDQSEKGIDINQCLKLFTEEEQLGKSI